MHSASLVRTEGRKNVVLTSCCVGYIDSLDPSLSGLLIVHDASYITVYRNIVVYVVAWWCFRYTAYTLNTETSNLRSIAGSRSHPKPKSTIFALKARALLSIRDRSWLSFPMPEFRSIRGLVPFCTTIMCCAAPNEHQT